MDFTLIRTWPTFYAYTPVYKISIQYTNPFKRYRTETICITYGTDGLDGRTYGQRWYYMSPHALPRIENGGGIKTFVSETLQNIQQNVPQWKLRLGTVSNKLLGKR